MENGSRLILSMSMLRHSVSLDTRKRFYTKLFQQKGDISESSYGTWLRAAPRHSVLNFDSKWLRQEPVIVKRSEKAAELEL